MSRWAATDDWLAEALADAKRRGDGWRRHGFDEVLAAAFPARLRTGERLRDILRDPVMPRHDIRRPPAEVAWACAHREHWYLDQLLEIIAQVPVIGMKEARRRVAPLSRQVGQLKRRPGARRR